MFTAVRTFTGEFTKDFSGLDLKRIHSSRFLENSAHQQNKAMGMPDSEILSIKKKMAAYSMTEGKKRIFIRLDVNSCHGMIAGVFSDKLLNSLTCSGIEK